ncbi:hypothetical protein LY78DRAFT_40506 [Colletotrichum sublineola]|nr:hypothetical protein LY78DRAFT_40506 [Colletotrichum sublineola]
MISTDTSSVSAELRQRQHISFTALPSNMSEWSPDHVVGSPPGRAHQHATSQHGLETEQTRRKKKMVMTPRQQYTARKRHVLLMASALLSGIGGLLAGILWAVAATRRLATCESLTLDRFQSASASHGKGGRKH